MWNWLLQIEFMWQKLNWLETKDARQVYFVFLQIPAQSCPYKNQILTDQSRDAVEFGVEGTFAFPRIHFTRLETENVFLKQ